MTEIPLSGIIKSETLAPFSVQSADIYTQLTHGVIKNVKYLSIRLYHLVLTRIMVKSVIHKMR